MTASWSAPPLLEARGVGVRYGGHEALREVSLAVAVGEVVALIGPNGSGKSTLLRTLARMLRPGSGTVTFAGREAWRMSPREFARRVAFLPQAPEAPPDLTVEELAWRGRFPHRGLLGAAGVADRAAVESALAQTRLEALRGRSLATLSGGERQRAWIALALAQEPELLLLDEPTTFLDIGHQQELLGLLATLNEERGLTVVMALHDVSQAALHAHRIVGIREGAVVFEGAPSEVVTTERLSTLFGAEVSVLRDPTSGVPLIVPRRLRTPLASAAADEARRRTGSEYRA